MAAIVNDRDASILNAANRFTPDPNRNMFVTPSSGVFKIKGSISDPGQFVFVANLLNLSGNVTWTWSAGITPAVANGNSSYAGNLLTITLADMGTQMSGKVTATIVFEGITYVREATVAKVADGIVGFLTNESATLGASSAGVLVNGALANGNGTFKVFDGINDVTGTAAVTYSVASETGCDYSIAGTGVYTLAGMSAGTATAVLQAVYGNVTIQKTVTLAKAMAGAAGTPATYVDITANGLMFTRANATVAYAPAQLYLTATPTGGTATYQWQYWDGAGWANIAGATASGITVNSGDFAASRTYRVVATIGGNPYYDQISLAQITGGKDGSNGGQGPRGTVNISKIVGFNYWDDGTANQAILDAGYSARQSRDVVTLTNNAGFAQQKFWNAGTGTWDAVSMLIPGNLIVDGTIGAQKIITNGLELRDINGNVTFAANVPLNKQAATNPNLCPSPKGFRYYSNGATGNRNGDARFGDGQYLFLPTAPDNRYVGADSFPLNIPANSNYTVSFEAYVEGSVGRAIYVDVYNGIDYDSQGMSATLVSGNLTRFSFVEGMINSSNAPLSCLRVFSVGAGGGNIVVANIKVELGVTVTPWCNSVIGPDNASVFIQNGTINYAHINTASISNLKALSAQIGFFQSAPVGNNRVEISDGLIEIWAFNNARRIRLSAN